MPGYADATRELVALIESGGLDASADPRNLTIPGAWVQPTGRDFDRLDAETYTATWSLYLVAPDNGPLDSLDTLDDLAAQLLAVLPDLGAGAVVGVQLPNHSPDPLPALQFTVEMEVS